MDKPTEWLYNYFSKEDEIPGKTYEEQINIDFFEVGLIDSLGIIELIEEIETVFNITLKPEHMQDTRFRTIKGLAEIIEENQKK